jgi:hypothetical protein
MDIIGWLWWLLSTLVGTLLGLIWFLIAGWVSTLLQIAVLIGAVYLLKYGWQRAPVEMWRRTRAFVGFFLNWIRAREAAGAAAQPAPVRIVKAKEFGDINISTLLSLLMLIGIIILAAS